MAPQTNEKETTKAVDEIKRSEYYAKRLLLLKFLMQI